MTGTNAFAIASLIMPRPSSSMQKFFNILSVLSFALVAILTGGTTFGYFWITNESNQKMIQDKLTEKIMGKIKLPKLSSPVLPTSPPPGLPKF